MSGMGIDRTSQYGMDPDHLTDDPAVRSAGPDGHVDPVTEFAYDTSHPAGAVAALRTTAAIRERAAALLARARAGDSAWFTIGDDTAMDDAARSVTDVTRERYAWRPDSPAQPLAPFRGRRRRPPSPSSTSCWASRWRRRHGRVRTSTWRW